jgi:hypothetical protein
MRDVNRYQAVNNTLRWDLWQRPNRTPPPFSRPVVDSGEAYKRVYLSKAPAHFTSEQLSIALDSHVRKMQKELAQTGKLVISITKTLDGQDGDVRLIMKWVVLGAKRTKHWRRIHGKVSGNASSLEPVQGSAAESGPSAVQADVPQGSL